jgi:hypothetical protein
MSGSSSHSSDKKAIRVLCLHGTAQNAETFRKRLQPTIDLLPSNWTFVVPDGPIIQSAAKANFVYK